MGRLPWDASPVRLRNRDQVNGRPRGYVGTVELLRKRFRSLVHRAPAHRWSGRGGASRKQIPRLWLIAHTDGLLKQQWPARGAHPSSPGASTLAPSDSTSISSRPRPKALITRRAPRWSSQAKTVTDPHALPQ
ncbi:MAG: hypothetical protein WBA72_12025 [Ornithinimicrobium sp.]